MTRSLFSNLYKAGFVHLGEDARVIDMNAILEKRLKEEAERRSCLLYTSDAADE